MAFANLIRFASESSFERANTLARARRELNPGASAI
jgi:hypothetical protein